MTGKTTAILVSALLATTASADVGDLTYVPCRPGEALRARPLFAPKPDFAKPTEGSGTVNPNAVVATLRAGEMVIKAAIDSAEPDAKTPDIIRFDFTGQGRFDAGHVVPLESRGRPGRATFGPKTLDLVRGDKTIRVTVKGRYTTPGLRRYLWLELASAGAGKCQFGDKTYSVQILDGNSNLRLGDTTKLAQKDGRVKASGPSDQGRGDTLIIRTSEGAPSKSGAKVFYGQPVMVDGKWYAVTISPDELKVSAKPIDVEAGQIVIDHSSWRGTFVGTKHVLRLSGGDNRSLTGGNKPISIPADSYVIADFTEFARPTDPKGRSTVLRSAGRILGSGSKAKVFEVPAGQTTTIAIGSPLTAGVKATQRGSKMMLSLELVDASGSAIDSLQIPGAKYGRPAAPKVEIFDAEGKRAYKCTLEYG